MAGMGKLYQLNQRRLRCANRVYDLYFAPEQDLSWSTFRQRLDYWLMPDSLDFEPDAHSVENIRHRMTDELGIRWEH